MTTRAEERVAAAFVSAAFVRWLAQWRVGERVPFDEPRGEEPRIRRIGSGAYLWR